MSVKDKIAMWNNMGAKNNSTPPLATLKKDTITTKKTNSQEEHTTTTTYTPKVTAQQNQKHQVQTPAIVVPSQVKKDNLFMSGITNDSKKQEIKPFAPQQKKIVQVAPTIERNKTGDSKEIQFDEILTPSEIKKKLEEETKGRAFYFSGPQQTTKKFHKEIEQPVEDNTEPNKNKNTIPQSQIQSGPVRISVKENAKKIDQFYHNKQSRQTKMVGEDTHTSEQIKPIESAHKKQEYTKNQEEEAPPAVTIPTKSEEATEDLSLSNRLKKKKQMQKKDNFDSDEE